MLEKSEKLPELNARWRLPAVVGGMVLLLGVPLYLNQQQQAGEAAKQAKLTAVVAPTTVTALGKLEPQGEVIKLSAPTSAEGVKIEKLLVKEGETVKAGQLIAVLDSYGRLQAAVNESRAKINVAQANLAKVKAGAKQGEINAQKATVGRLQAERGAETEAQRATLARVIAEQDTQVEAQTATVRKLVVEKDTQIESQQAAMAELQAELANAQSEYQRYESLYRQGVISASVKESKRLMVQTVRQKLHQSQANLKRITASGTQQIAEANANLRRIQTSGTQQINEARANLRKIETSRQQQIEESKFTLDRISEVRPVDIVAATAEVNSAIASLKRAEENLAQAYIKSPQAGQIFGIYARPGEIVGTDGIVEIGQTSQMKGVVEVYQSDVRKIRVGQQVKITSSSLAGELKGTVERVGIQVKRQNTINADPTTNIDDRVVEVHVNLDPAASAKAAKFTNLQIQAVIELGDKG